MMIPRPGKPATKVEFPPWFTPLRRSVASLAEPDALLDPGGGLSVLPVTMPVLIAGTGGRIDPYWPEPPEATVTGDGNAALSLSAPTPITGTRPVWVIEGILYSFICSNVVATRTTAAPVLRTGITKRVAEAGAIEAKADVSLVDTLTLEGFHEGTVFAGSNGARYKNQNGTFTFTANGGPCPLKAEEFTANVAAATNGNALDKHRLTLLIRQVA